MKKIFPNKEKIFPNKGKIFQNLQKDIPKLGTRFF